MVDPAEYATFCAENGMPAAAITDHGNMGATVEYYVAAKKVGVNPLIGQEIYLVDDHLDKDSKRYHEGLIAMNHEGYLNLCKLSTLGFTEGLHRNYFSCIDDAQIEVYNKGIICLSGCISSRLSRTIMGGLEEQAYLLDKARRLEQCAINPTKLSEARRDARNIALSAAKAIGTKRVRLLEEAKTVRAELDLVEELLASDGLFQYLIDMEKQAMSTWDIAWKQAQVVIEKRQSIFGDRYYLETQICPSDSQKTLNKYLRQLSKLTCIPCVVTADAHYLKQSDAELHRTMLKVRTEGRKSKGKKATAKEITFPPDQEKAILASSGEEEDLYTLYDSIVEDEAACLGKKPNLETKKHQTDRTRWARTAQIFFLQQSHDENLEVEEDQISLDAIDPGRAYADWMAEFWVRTPQEMIDAGADPQEMENTALLSDRVHLELDINSDTHKVVHMPELDSNVDSSVTLSTMCRTALSEYLDSDIKLDRKKYEDRLSYELDVINSAGFSTYFLIVEDYIKWVRERGGLTGPGRGSAAASLVTFLLGITRVLDPLKYPDMMFERFLTPGRADMPDIDTDFDFDSAERVYEHCRAKYGEGKVAKIGTFSQMGARQALQDVGRVLDIPFPDVERATSIFKDFRPDDDVIKDDNRAMFPLEDAAKLNPDLVALRDKSEDHKLWFSYADALQGAKRNASQHASGVAIAEADLVDLGVPLMMTEPKGKSPVITTQFSMDDLTTLGVPKFDILKLSTLNVISLAEQLIGDDFSIEEVPLDDPATYEQLCKGDNLAVFQMSAPKVKGVLRAVQPRKLEDLAAIISIIRPGLVARDKETGMTMEELFIARRQNSVPIHYPISWLEEMTGSTLGIPVYQEACLRIIWKVGFSPLEADKLRKVLGKKLRSKAKEFESRFLDLAKSNLSLSQEDAQWLWDLVEEFAGYSFNVSHALAYALIGYWTAYLKTHYPAQFFSAVVTIQNQKNTQAAKKLIPQLLEDANQMGRSIPILPPNINKSSSDFKIEMDGPNHSIRFGLEGIKNVGNIASIILQERRENGEFSSLNDLDVRLQARMGKKPNKNALKSLVLAGALDDLFTHRSEALWEIERIRAKSQISLKNWTDLGWKPEKLVVLSAKQAELCGNFFFTRDNLSVLGREVDNFFEHSSGDRVTIGGRVVDAKLYKKSKNQNVYHSILLKTQWGDVRADFFPARGADKQSYLDDLKAQLFSGAIIIVKGSVRDNRSIFANSVSLPRKSYRATAPANTESST